MATRPKRITNRRINVITVTVTPMIPLKYQVRPLGRLRPIPNLKKLFECVEVERFFSSLLRRLAEFFDYFSLSFRLLSSS